jgi:hypothetical protein
MRLARSLGGHLNEHLQAFCTAFLEFMGILTHFLVFGHLRQLQR